MKHRISSSPETLMHEASSTACEYLRQAIHRIDGELGQGYAQNNPTLVAAFMVTAASDYRASMSAMAIADAAEGIANALDAVGQAIKSKG